MVAKEVVAGISKSQVSLSLVRESSNGLEVLKVAHHYGIVKDSVQFPSRSTTLLVVPFLWYNSKHHVSLERIPNGTSL